jgi:hypothetical protein
VGRATAPSRAHATGGAAGPTAPGAGGPPPRPRRHGRSAPGTRASGAPGPVVGCRSRRSWGTGR